MNHFHRILYPERKSEHVFFYYYLISFIPLWNIFFFQSITDYNSSLKKKPNIIPQPFSKVNISRCYLLKSERLPEIYWCQMSPPMFS